MAHPAPARKTFHALVLAAGQGSRMGHLTSSLPKSCLPLTADGSATFIRRIVDLSLRCGAESIIVAVAFAWEQVRNELTDYSELVELIRVDLGTPTTGSLVTLSRAVQERPALVAGSHHLLIQDADILYSAQSLNSFVHPAVPAGSRLLTYPASPDDAEEVIAYGDGTGVRTLGKALASGATAGLTPLGESAGVCLIDKADLSWVNNYLTTTDITRPHRDSQRNLDRTANPPSEWEELMRALAADRELTAVRAPDALFVEVDTPADYIKAVQLYEHLADASR